MRGIFIIVFILCIGMVNALDLSDMNTKSLSYYNFSNDFADSSSSFDFTNSGVTLSTVKIGNGSVFDGSSNMYNTANAGFNHGENVTYAMWISRDDLSCTRREILTDRSTSGYIIISQCLSAFGSPNDISAGMYDETSDSWKSVDFNITDSNLHRIEFVVDRDNGIYAYTDKVLVDSVLSSTFTFRTTLTDGVYVGSTSSNSYYFDGKIDELEIINKAKNITEIEFSYASGNPDNNQQYPYTLADITYYGFEITSKNVTSSINNFNATIKNSSILYEYSTTNGTIKTNSSFEWKSGLYNITVESVGYSNWGIDEFYWSSTINNSLNSVMYSGGSTNQCIGDFIVSSSCTAIIQGGNTYVVS